MSTVPQEAFAFMDEEQELLAEDASTEDLVIHSTPGQVG